MQMKQLYWHKVQNDAYWVLKIGFTTQWLVPFVVERAVHDSVVIEWQGNMCTPSEHTRSPIYTQGERKFYRFWHFWLHLTPQNSTGHVTWKLSIDYGHPVPGFICSELNQPWFCCATQYLRLWGRVHNWMQP